MSRKQWIHAICAFIVPIALVLWMAPDSPLRAAGLEDGRKAWVANCAGCHAATVAVPLSSDTARPCPQVLATEAGVPREALDSATRYMLAMLAPQR